MAPSPFNYRLASKGLKEPQREALAAYIFIFPTLLGFLVFTIGPIFAAFFSALPAMT